MGAPDSQTFNHLQHTVRLHVVEHLHLATGPLKLDLTNDAVGAQSEMDSLVRRADVSHGCGDVVELDAPGTASQLDAPQYHRGCWSGLRCRSGSSDWYL